MDWWGVIVDALLDTLKLLPFLLLLYILIELIEHNTKVGRAGVLLGRAAPLVGSAVGLLPMCGFSVMAAKLYEHRHVTLGTLLAVFIATSDEAFLVMLLSGDIGWGQKAVSVLAMCGIKLFLGVAVGYLADVFGRRRRALVPLAEGVGQPHAHEHGHAEEDAECGGHTEAGAHGETYTVCEHKHGLKSNLRVYLLSPLLHALKVAAFVLLVNLAFGFLFEGLGEENVVDFLQGSGYWYQPLLCAALGFVPNCASSVILAEVYCMGGISFGSCLAGLIVNAGLGYLVLFKNVRAWKRTLAIALGMIALGIAVGYAVNAIALVAPPPNI